VMTQPVSHAVSTL